MENSHILVVEVTDRDMTGPIECIAVNGVGQPAIAGIYLIVQCNSITLFISFNY